MAAAALASLSAALLAFASPAGETNGAGPARAAAASPALVERGAYLARAGNCLGCHTERGGAEYAGGRGIETPFGIVYAPNLTPDAGTGLGEWSADDFWSAMHEGRSKDGRMLYPAFPYPYYTEVSREDSDAIFAFLKTLRPVAQANKPHRLRFPYDQQVALGVWRSLFFKPSSFQPDAGQSEEWNRGAYLVRSLGHCGACHSPRNLLGASTTEDEFGGAALPSGHWYAPSLTSPDEAGVADWPVDEIVALLASGVSSYGSALGPMAEVVFESTQYLSETDLRAIAVYLQSLPQRAAPPAAMAPLEMQTLEHGGKIYEDQCAQCHGKEGQGAEGAYPPLAGNRAVLMDHPSNAIRVVLDGGFPPATQRNPRPYGMPPFSHTMNDVDIAAVLSYVRNAWGNEAPPVTSLEVLRHR
jgi:mono/diheme cytochrome c family protein